jgi:hypothetical protein
MTTDGYYRYVVDAIRDEWLVPSMSVSISDFDWSRLQANLIDLDGQDRPTEIKCQHCGQWGKKHSACTFCGAPID